MSSTATTPDDLQRQILDQINGIISDAESNGKPLEVDPARNQLFELFVIAEAAGCVGEEAEPDLSADGICRSLSESWGLQQAAQVSVAQQTPLKQDELAKMRSLWSVMRMWMEWTYAWQRWSDFHNDSVSSDSKDVQSSGKDQPL